MEFSDGDLPEDGLLPEEEASRAVLDAAELLLLAIATGDHRALWDMLSEGARAYVLNIAVERGMDFDLGSRIRQGTASDAELDDYLTDLLEGIRRDLKGVDLSRLAFESKAEPHAPMQVRVTYFLQMEAAIGDIRPAIPAGSLIMIYEGGAWKVERLIPKPG